MPIAALRRRRSRATPTVALAGAGSIAVVHALAAGAAGMRVSAVASRGGISARHLAGELDARRVTPDALPAGADLLVVATPPSEHDATVQRGIAAGAAVLVEKPLTTTLERADRLVEAATTPGAPTVRCAENLLHAPAWRELRNRHSALGPLAHLSVRALQSTPDWGHFARPLADGGVLFDLGPHPIGLVLDLMAEAPVAVSASLGSERDDGADDHATVQVRFASGLTASVEVSWRAEVAQWDLQVAGDSGVLRLELLPEVTLEANGDPVPVPTRHQGPDPRLESLGYIDQLLDTVTGGPGQDLTAARDVLEVICAAYLSAGHESDEVELPLAGDRTRTPMELWRGAPRPQRGA